MKITWIEACFIVGAIIFGQTIGKAQSANFSGTWLWSHPNKLRALAHLSPQNFDTWFELAQYSDSTIKGSVTGVHRVDETFPVEGTVNNDSVIFSCTFGDAPNMTVVTFSGKLDGERIEGTETYQRGSVVTTHWTAIRTGRCHSEGDVIVDARSSDCNWNDALVLKRGQRAILRVPKISGEYQVWGIIDPQKRGPNTVTGNGVIAGGSFAASGFHQGALIVCYGNNQRTEFPASDGLLVIYDAGPIGFIANDEGGNASHLFHPGGLRNGYGDNYGSISVHYTIDGCPPPEPKHKPNLRPALRNSADIGIDVLSVSVEPSSISLGQAASLIIELSGPAPGGGLTIPIDHDFNGTQDTLSTITTSVTFPAGQTRVSIPLQTQVVPGAATTLIFISHTLTGARRAAQLTVLP